MLSRVFHLAFLATLPVAILLAVNEQWVWAAVVFLIGAPLFWTLRNRAASQRTRPAMRAEPRPGPQHRPGSDGFLPPDDPMVQGLGEPGERFLPPVGVVDWNEYLRTIDAPIAKEASKTRPANWCSRLTESSSCGLIALRRATSGSQAWSAFEP